MFKATGLNPWKIKENSTILEIMLPFFVTMLKKSNPINPYSPLLGQ